MRILRRQSHIIFNFCSEEGGASISDDKMYWFWLCRIRGIPRKIIEILLRYLGHPREIYFLRERELEDLLKGQLRTKQLEQVMSQFSRSLSLDAAKREYEKLKKAGILFFSCEDEEYPEKLKRIYDYPYGIYVKGRLPSGQKKAIAIVGARKATTYGREMARFFARELAKNGIEIISGLARGIDANAHIGCIEGREGTYGVLGCGIDKIYPRENIDLFVQMEKTGGIISEYGPGVEPLSFHFPFRNRIISGMSDGILVVEAARRSGSLITAEQGLEQGREIFALPGRTIDSQSEGCNLLIQKGAKLVLNVSDILLDMGINCEENLNIKKNLLDSLANREKLVYDCLSLEPKYIDNIAKECRMTLQETMSILFMLELNGYIKQVIQNYYIIAM